MSKRKNKADIFRDHATGDVVVLDENGKEVFRKPYSRQVVSIAHDIYMSHKYEPKSLAGATAAIGN